MESNTIANQIHQYLGGNGFRVSQGIKNFDALANGLHFRLPKVLNGINSIQIMQNKQGLFDVAFNKIWGERIISKSVKQDVNGDELQSVFTKETGCDALLPHETAHYKG